MLQQFLLRKMGKAESKCSLLFEIRGKLKRSGDSIGTLS
jgi:hypothetical protein